MIVWLIIAALAGVASGLANGLLGELPAGLHRLASVGALWLIVAFLIGSRLQGLAALAAGAVAIAAALAGSYGWAQLTDASFDIPHVEDQQTVWIVIAILAGAVFGLLGAIWRAYRGIPRAIAVAILVGVVSGESGFVLLDRGIGSATNLPGVALLAILAVGGLLIPMIMIQRLKFQVLAAGIGVLFIIFGSSAMPALRDLVERGG